MKKSKKRLVREVFNAAVKELKRKKQVTPKLYIFGEDGKKYTCSPTYRDPFEKMYETAVVREMCERVNATCVISVCEAYVADLNSNVWPSQNPNHKEAVSIYYEDVSENYLMLRKYHRTRHDKIVFTGKTKKLGSIEGPLANYLQRPEDNSPLAVSTKPTVRRL
jgi:hypothetical protein